MREVLPSVSHMSEHERISSLDDDARKLLVDRHAELVKELNEVLQTKQRIRAACEARAWPRARPSRVNELRAQLAQLETRSEELTALIHHLSALMAGHDLDLLGTGTPLQDHRRNSPKSTTAEPLRSVDMSADADPIEATLAGLSLAELRELSVEQSEQLNEVERQIRLWHEHSHRSQNDGHTGESLARLRMLETRREKLNKCLDDIADAMLQVEEEDLWQATAEPNAISAQTRQHFKHDAAVSAGQTEPLRLHSEDTGRRDATAPAHIHADEVPTESWTAEFEREDNPAYTTHTSSQTMPRPQTAADDVVDPSSAQEYRSASFDDAIEQSAYRKRTHSVSPVRHREWAHAADTASAAAPGYTSRYANERAQLIDAGSVLPTPEHERQRQQQQQQQQHPAATSRMAPRYSAALVQQRVERARERLAQRGEALRNLHISSAGLQNDASAFENLSERLARKNRLFGGRFWESFL